MSGLLAVPLISKGWTGEDPSFVQASQAQIADLTSISARVGPTGVVSYTFAGYHPAISGVVFTGKGAWDPKTKRASEELDFPQGKIKSSTTCPADPWSEGQPCAALGAGGLVSASIGAPVQIATLPWGPPVGAMLLSPQAHLKAKAAYAEGLRNRPTPTPTHTPVPRFALRSGGSGARAIVLPTPTPTHTPAPRFAMRSGGSGARAIVLPTPTPGPLGRAGTLAGTGHAVAPAAAAAAAPTPTPTPTATRTRTPTPTPTHAAAPGGSTGGATAKVARLPLASVAALLNDALQGTRIRLHTAAPGGGYANDSYVAPGPRLGGGPIPIGVTAPTFQAGAFTSTLFVNDVNSTGLSVTQAGDRFLVTVTFESAGPELLVRGPAPLDVEADNGRLLLTLTPGLDASGRPSFTALDADLSASIRCTAPNPILAGMCNSVEPFALSFLRSQTAQALRQTLLTPDFRGRVGAAMRALLDAPAGKSAIEKVAGHRVGTIRAMRFEPGVLVIEHD